MSVLLIFLLLLYSIGSGVSKYPVRNLPGVDGPLPFELETGCVNIDESNGIELFYFFFKSEENPVEDPLLIWSSGGLGCSALNAIFFGNGPLTPKLEEYTGNVPPMELNPYGWTKVSNVLYVDAPIETGFSYSTTVQGSYTSDTLSAKQSYTFIRKWLMDHKEFISNSVSIGVDSYSGMVVPIIVQNIAEGIEAGDKPLINLKGYLLGNPLTYPASEKYFRIPFAYGMGLIPRELYESSKNNCQGNYINKFSNSAQYDMDLDVEKCLDRLWRSNILLPKCEDVVPEYTVITYNIPKGSSGDHDPTVPFMSTEAWIRSLNYSITNEWRPWIVDKKVAGYTRTYANNMAFATVKGGSHIAMSSNPKECLVMYRRWVTYEPL